MKPTPNHPLRDGLLVTAAVMGVITFCILLLYFQARAAFERDQQHDLLNYAQAAALLVDGDLHQTLTAAEQEATPAYRLAVAPLERFLRAMPELHFVYTMIRQADGVHIVLDATPPGDANGDGVNDHAALLELYEPSTLSPALLAALTGGTARADCVAYTDKWGTFLSGFAPIRNSAGQLVGIVGVDITADLYLGRLQHFRHALFTALVAAASASLLFGGLVARLRQRQARAEIENREHSAFLQSILDNLPTPVFVKDTAGIYRACNRAFQEYVGLPRDRIVGRGVFDVAPPNWPRSTKPWMTRCSPGPAVRPMTAVYAMPTTPAMTYTLSNILSRIRKAGSPVSSVPCWTSPRLDVPNNATVICTSR